MRILVAEDERATRARIVACLREFGHVPVEAANGREAWEIIREQEVPIVVSDWQMPKIDGPTLVRRIRSEVRDGYVYVILLTSRSERDDIIAGMDAGADDFMVKPFDKEELRARIRAGERVIQLEQALAEKNRSLLEANAKISEVNQQMKDELCAAARIQRSFLPTDLPQCAHAEFAWLYEPCDELGGDTLNIIPLSDHQYALYVIDVSGHGVSAALLSVQISRALTHLGAHEDEGSLASPPEVASMLNTRFQMDASNHQYFTLLYGVLDFQVDHFRYVSAGHPGPLLLRQGETVLDEATPPAIGFFPEPQFVEKNLSLEPGDRLFLYSDGIFEIDDPKGEEWGESRLAAAASRLPDQSIAENLHAVLESAKSWQNHERMGDDVSLIGIDIPNAG